MAACVLTLVAPVGVGTASARSAIPHCRTAMTKNADNRTLILCGTILEYVDAQHHWNAGEPKVAANYGNDPARASAAGRAAWIKLASYSINALKAHHATCTLTKEVPLAMRYLRSTDERAAFYAMCQAGTDVLVPYRLVLRVFTQRREATTAEQAAVRKATADTAKHQAKVAAVLKAALS